MCVCCCRSVALCPSPPLGSAMVVRGKVEIVSRLCPVPWDFVRFRWKRKRRILPLWNCSRWSWRSDSCSWLRHSRYLAHFQEDKSRKRNPEVGRLVARVGVCSNSGAVTASRIRNSNFSAVRRMSVAVIDHSISTKLNLVSVHSHTPGRLRQTGHTHFFLHLCRRLEYLTNDMCLLKLSGRS